MINGDTYVRKYVFYLKSMKHEHSSRGLVNRMKSWQVSFVDGCNMGPSVPGRALRDQGRTQGPAAAPPASKFENPLVTRAARGVGRGKFGGLTLEQPSVWWAPLILYLCDV